MDFLYDITNDVLLSFVMRRWLHCILMPHKAVVRMALTEAVSSSQYIYIINN